MCVCVFVCAALVYLVEKALEKMDTHTYTDNVPGEIDLMHPRTFMEYSQTIMMI